MRWAAPAALVEEERGAYGFLVRRSQGKRPLERPRRRWEDNTKMNFQRCYGELGLDLSGSG